MNRPSSRFTLWLSYDRLRREHGAEMANKKYKITLRDELEESPEAMSIYYYIVSEPYYNPCTMIHRLQERLDIGLRRKKVTKANWKASNDLNSAVVAWLKAKGHEASRHNTRGIPIIVGKVFKGYRPVSEDERGAADVRCVLRPSGRALWIETKIKDRQSPDQFSFQRRIEAAGGLYVIVHSVDELMEWYGRNVE